MSVNIQLQDVGVLRMYFDMRAVTLRATEDYSWQSMIGEIGGYATLLLGIAVIDLVRNSIPPKKLKILQFKREI